MNHTATPHMNDTQTLRSPQMHNSPLLYHTLSAIASAHAMDAAMEALELAEQLVAVAFTSSEMGVAGVVLDAATRKVESYIEVA